jgi:16S rRNA G966 N2-methylase RsmD
MNQRCATRANFHCIDPGFGVDTIPKFHIGSPIGCSQTKCRANRAVMAFIDPPYDNIEANLERIFAKADELASPEARIILELPGNLVPEIAGWKIVRRFGRPKRDTPNAAIFERDKAE